MRSGGRPGALARRPPMALAVAGLFAEGVTEIEDAECVEISYPGFFDQLEALAEC